MTERHASAEFSCPTTKKFRGRPKGSLGETATAIRDAVEELTGRYDRMTVRQVFYQLEMAGVVEKTEAGYRQVQNQVLVMRRKGLLDWGFITDGTRWQRKPKSYADAGEYAERIARSYRRDLWQRQGVRIEIWLEKDALADVILDVTKAWDVSLMVSRGQSSSTFLYTAGKFAEQAWKADETDTFVYMLYDFDAGGERAARTIARDLPEFAGEAWVNVHRLAVTEEQVREWSLPTRPAKKSDPEAKKFGDKAVELDAIDPKQLTTLVENAILSHVDRHAWEVEKRIEKEERAGLLAMAQAWNSNGNGSSNNPPKGHHE